MNDSLQSAKREEISGGFLRARSEWVSACNFHDLEDTAVLQAVLRRLARPSTGKKPVVVFDLDSTLYEVGPRTLQILKEWHASTREPLPIDLRKALCELTLEGIGYSLTDTFRLSGLEMENPEVMGAIEQLREFWFPLFFSNAYLRYDRPYPGAAEFVQQVHRLGAEVVYLTARERSRMIQGTEANLLRDGFPYQVEGTRLFMKDEKGRDDLDHKQGIARFLPSLGEVVASFENEPRNLAGFAEVLPDAMHVFVDTICSDQPAPLCAGLYRIRSYNC